MKVIPIEPLGLPIVVMPIVCRLKVIPQMKLTVFRATPFAPAKLCAHGAVFFERVIETANLRPALPVVLLMFLQL